MGIFNLVYMYTKEEFFFFFCEARGNTFNLNYEVGNNEKTVDALEWNLCPPFWACLTNSQVAKLGPYSLWCITGVLHTALKFSFNIAFLVRSSCP